MRNKFNKEIELEICDKYKNGISGPPLAKEYKCDLHTILNIVRRNGYHVRSQSHKNRRYTLNEHYFDIIDSPDKAQILGFLYADGYNNEKCNKVVIGLHYQDIEYLKKINNYINYSRSLSIYQSKTTKVIRLVISNKHISEQLSNKGCFQAKSLILKFPSNDIVPKKFIWDFIRGYFEGDGAIWKSKTRDSFGLSIVSTLNMTNKMIKLIKLLNIKGHKRKQGKVYYLTICGNRNILKFMNKIYKNPEFVMDRKYKKYQELVERCNYLDKNT